MTEQLLNDPVWRKKNRLCTFLSLLPLFGWMGFVFMGKRSGRKQFTVAGTIYGVLSGAAYLLLSFSPLGRFRSFLYQAGEVCPYLLIGLWLVCMVHTLLLGTQYLQFLALKQSASPARDPLTADKKWRRENLGWMIWSYFPVTGWFSVWTVGRRLKSRGLTMLGLLCGSATAAVLMITPVYELVIGNYSPFRYEFCLDYVFIYLCIIPLLVSFLFREDYLDQRASTWSKDTRVFPNLKNRKWRLRNSLWQIWTLFPIVGGIGISIAGVRSGNRKCTVKGAVLSLIAAAIFGITVTRDSIVAMLGMELNFRQEYAFLDFFQLLLIFLYLIILFYGTFIRWDVLRGRASALQGYGSEFERELDIQNRMRARGMEIPTEPARQAPKSEPAKPEPVKQEAPPAPDPVPAAPEKPAAQIVTRPMDVPAAPAVPQKAPAGQVDINHCTQSELMELPGIGVAQAKRAMEHRQTSGRFQSVDEFVELLQIKPHFAVQIFSRATVGQAAPAEEKPASDPAPVRRRIDF